jgi:hypothetical protein
MYMLLRQLEDIKYRKNNNYVHKDRNGKFGKQQDSVGLAKHALY